jgi:hypothetical protein
MQFTNNCMWVYAIACKLFTDILYVHIMLEVVVIITYSQAQFVRARLCIT